MTTRRQLVVALGAGALAEPLAAFAQQVAKVYRIGFLGPTPASGAAIQVEAVRAGLRALGYVEGKNLIFEWRFADGEVERLPALATDLVRLNVDVIVAASPPAIRAAQKATAAIPIIMAGIGDPVAGGFAKSLARPGGNLTGVSNFASDLVSKHVEMLVSMVPNLARVAVLRKPTNMSGGQYVENVKATARKFGIAVLLHEVRNQREIETAFSTMTREKAGAVIVARDPLFNQQAGQIAELAVKHRLPVIAGPQEFAEAGGLMSYGVSLSGMWGRVPNYVDKIFKGARPGDLPIEEPTQLELVINMKTARALKLDIPRNLTVRADRFID